MNNKLKHQLTTQLVFYVYVLFRREAFLVGD